MIEKNLNLADVMLMAYKLYNNPSDKKLEDEVNNYISKMVVLSYLPLREKEVAIFRILNFIQDNERRPEEINTEVELLFTLEIINQYTNIEVEKDFYELFKEEFYDALMMTGIIEAIEDICDEDIIRLRRMLDSTINWRNIFNLIQGFESIDMSHVDQLVKEVQEAKEGLKEENLDLLKRIADYNQPNVHNFSDMISASIVNSLDKISDEQIAKWHENQDLLVNLDGILGDKSYENITNNIMEYFNKHSELGKVDEKEIESVYEYLKEKNQEVINKLDYSIAEENKVTIEKGISSQMIKLLSKKKALEKKYKKEEELLRLADTIMSMDGTNIDELLEVLNQYQKTNINENIQEKEKIEA